ncbi:MAG: hypothetical protein AAFO58_05880, partial [Pseudomonadota bacterium]
MHLPALDENDIVGKGPGLPQGVGCHYDPRRGRGVDATPPTTTQVEAGLAQLEPASGLLVHRLYGSWISIRAVV